MDRRLQDGPRGALRFLQLAGLVVGLTLGASILGRLHGLMIEDDAFIFARYADNILRDGEVAWNPGGPPTYGTTSLLYLVVVLITRAVVGVAPATVVVAASSACGVAFIVLMGLLVRREWSPMGSARRAGLLLLLLFPAASFSDSFAAHFATGMDTTFTWLWVALLLAGASGLERRPTSGRAAAFAVVAGATPAARPDLLVLALPLVLALGLRPSPGGSRRQGAGVAVAAVVVAAAIMTLAWAYFRVPVPLSFFVKSLVRYGGDLEAEYARVPWRELSRYLASYGVLLVPVVVAAVRDLRCRHWRFSPVESALLVGVTGFILYFRFGVLQVMPHYERFYYPTLPALLFLAVRSSVRLWREFDADRAGGSGRRRWGGLAAVSACAALGLLVAASSMVVWRRAGERIAGARPFFELGAMENLGGNPRRNWFGLEALAGLPDDVVVAATEIGLPGVMLPRKRILDLSGLNEPRFARGGFDPDVLFATDPPDFIYMPHPDYRRMTERILQHPVFLGDYEYYPGRGLRTVLGIAVRKTSPRYPEMRAVLPARVQQRRSSR